MEQRHGGIERPLAAETADVAEPELQVFPQARGQPDAFRLRPPDHGPAPVHREYVPAAPDKFPRVPRRAATQLEH